MANWLSPDEALPADWGETVLVYGRRLHRTETLPEVYHLAWYHPDHGWLIENSDESVVVRWWQEIQAIPKQQEGGENA